MTIARSEGFVQTGMPNLATWPGDLARSFPFVTGFGVLRSISGVATKARSIVRERSTHDGHPQHRRRRALAEIVSPVAGIGSIPVGTSFVSPGRTVTEADIVSFSGLSGDYSEIHTNEHFAQTTSFGRRMAHGLLIMSMQSGLFHRAVRVHIPVIAFLGIKEWRFLKPVFAGDTIRLRVILEDVRDSRTEGRSVTTWKREILNQDDVIVQDGLTALLVRS